MRCLLLFLCVFCTGISYAGPEPQKLLEKAMGFLETENFGLTFRKIGFDLASPEAIFDKQAAGIYQEGHIYRDGNNYEIDLGKMKSLSDGQLLVMINNEFGQMYIDSVRGDAFTKGLDEQEQNRMPLKMLQGLLSGPDLQYRGKKTAGGTTCHVIAAEYEDYPVSSYYYINARNGELHLMADKHGDKYDVYWVEARSKAPEDYEYDIQIPDRELTELYGYEVFDMRYATQGMR